MKDFREILTTYEKMGDHRILNPIKLGNYNLSIQASYSHYCEPRKTVDINDYKSMEIAIFDSNDEWVQPREDGYIRQFSRYEELIDDYELGSVAVRGWTPIDLIQDLCNYLEKSNM